MGNTKNNQKGHYTKVVKMALINDIYNPATPKRGFKIPDMVAGSPTSDLKIFDIGASSLSELLAYSHSRPLVQPSCTLILNSQLEEIIRILLLYDPRIKNLKVEVNFYVSDEI